MNRESENNVNSQEFTFSQEKSDEETARCYLTQC